MRKGEIACYMQFLLYLQCFLPYMALIFHALKNVVCNFTTWSRLSMTQRKQPFENIVWKGKIANNQHFLLLTPFFSSTGCRPASLCHGCCLSCVRPPMRLSACALTFSLNIVFSETTYWILMKFHRNVPTMVFFRISWNNLIPSKTLVAIATKLKIFVNLWKSSCQKP